VSDTSYERRWSEGSEAGDTTVVSVVSSERRYAAAFRSADLNMEDAAGCAWWRGGTIGVDVSE
jgi:hypothetical protein